jgi:hypothetical protein
MQVEVIPERSSEMLNNPGMKYLIAFIIPVFLNPFTSCSDKPEKNDQTTSVKEAKAVRCQLVEMPPNPIECGVIKNLVGYKFKRTDSIYTLIVLIPCPELFGQGFFAEKRTYDITFSSDTGDLKDYVTLNKFESEGLKTFFAKDIKKIGN